MLEEIGHGVSNLYANVAADIIRRGERRRESSPKWGVESATHFMSIVMGVNSWSFFLLLGGDPRSLSKLQLAGIAVLVFGLLDVLNRRLIRLWVLDDKGCPRRDLGGTRASRVAGQVCLWGTCALLIFSSVA